MDKEFIAHYLRRVAKKFPRPHHKNYALHNAADAIENAIMRIDENTSIEMLKKIKFVGPFVSELVYGLIHNQVPDEYRIDESNLLIDNPVFFKLARELAEEFGVMTLSDLKRYCRVNETVLNKIDDNYLSYLELNRVSFWIDSINKIIIDDKIFIAGSLRRGKLAIGDFDMVSTMTYAEVVSHLSSISSDNLKIELINKGHKRVRIQLTHQGKVLEGDIRIVPESGLATAMLYFTGSKELNVRMRGIAKSKGMVLNEYGIKREGKLITFNSEVEVFEYLGLKYIDPKNR